MSACLDDDDGWSASVDDDDGKSVGRTNLRRMAFALILKCLFAIKKELVESTHVLVNSRKSLAFNVTLPLNSKNQKNGVLEMTSLWSSVNHSLRALIYMVENE